MGDREQIEYYLERFRAESDGILFDIEKKGWVPGYEELDKFCRELYKDIVDKYMELERTQEYVMTGEVLYAIDTSGETLAFSIGGGLTACEITATNAIGWELDRLLRKQKTDPQTFDFRLLVAGYKEIIGGSGNRQLVIEEPLRVLGIERPISH